MRTALGRALGQTEGEGQFARTSGLITSNFFGGEDLAVTDHHFGVIFVR
jgi:hypothetical protein